MKVLRNVWTEFEKCQLLLAYRIRTPLEVISKKLGRSQTAINKALARYKIRPVGVNKRGVKAGAPNITYRDLEIILETCCLNHSPNYGRYPSNAIFRVTGSLRKKFKAYGISSPLPWEEGKKPFVTYSDKEIMKARFENKVSLMYLEGTLEQDQESRMKNSLIHNWMTFERLVTYARKRGLDVKKYGSKVTLNAVEVNAKAILVQVNRDREKDGLSPIYVRGITES